MLIKNGMVYTPDFKFCMQDLKTEGDKISDKSGDDLVIDAKDLFVVPGFIDTHFHGVNGSDFMDGTEESLHNIASTQAQFGVTSITPATMTMSMDAIQKSLNVASNFISKDDESNLLGVYMEGPYVSKNKLGAQNPKYAITPDIDEFKKLQSNFNNLIKTVVVAPEIDNAIDFIKATKDIVKISIGHTDSNYEQSKKAFDNGATRLTHMFNAMNGIHHRKPGPIGAAIDKENIYCELICDGVHIHDSVIKMAFKLFDNLTLISDSMRATGLKDGQYDLGGQNVFVKGNLATLDDGTIAGSVTNLYQCFVHCVKDINIPIEHVLKTVTYNPAKSIGAENTVGSLKIGNLADVLLLDKNLEIKYIILRGKIIAKK